jgi:hypothetical protein
MGDGGATATTGPTPWFLYFMVMLLMVLVILIILFCLALNDPNFPSRSHRGPNLTNNNDPTASMAYSNKAPVTGARALPHEIPFALHRPPPLPKTSFIHRQNINDDLTQSTNQPLTKPSTARVA